MPNISELNKLLEEVLFETSLDEKIMTKEQAARRRKLRAKKKAERKARREAEKQKEQELKNQENQDTENTEEQEKDEPGTALVTFQQPTNDEYDDYNEVSEVFKKAMELFGPALEKHKQEIEKAMKMWESAGKDKACPQEAWEILNNSITELKNEVENFVNQTDFNNMAEPELIIIDKVITALNGYIEKAQQEIMAIKPNLVEDDFKAPIAQTGSTDLTTNNDSQNNPSNQLALSGPTSLANKNNKTQVPATTSDNSRTRNNIVDYEGFLKGFNDTFASLDGLIKGLGSITKMILTAGYNGALALIKLASHPLSWIDDRIWSFLNSPVAKDFVKTLAYSNPLTAFIFDGKLGSFGIGNAIDKLHNAVKNLENKGQKVKFKTITDKKPDDYDARKFPKDLSTKNLKQLTREFYCNKALVDCINVSYNHPEVRIEDKALLRKSCNTMARAIETKKIETVRKTFNTIISTLNKVCDYMSWTKPFDWQNLVTKYVAAGNTQKELKRIETKNKPKTGALTLTNKVAKDASSYIKEKLPRKELVKKLTSDTFGHKEEDVNKYLDSINYNESYNPKFKELISLIEQAEA